MDNKIHTLTLEETVYTPAQLKDSALLVQPQIALAGRSNVGKSSLINALAVRKQLAKVSSTPGKTASVNFYRVEPGGYYLVDLPGYGYAQRSKTEREKWSKLIDAYLREAPAIKLLAVLLDSRLEPQNVDLDLIAYAASLNLELLPVLTKADKCNQKERSARKAQWAKLLRGKNPVLTSASGPATKRLGLEELWRVMDSAMLEAGTPPDEE